MENLNVALWEEYGRLKKQLDTFDVRSDDWKDSHSKLIKVAQEIKDVEKIKAEYEAKREERRIEEMHNRNMEDLERRKLIQHMDIEDARNTTQIMLENTKQKITWQKVLFEAGKILLPLTISIIHYNNAQKRILSFEEHGRIVSTPGRELHLPKILTKN